MESLKIQTHRKGNGFRGSVGYASEPTKLPSYLPTLLITPHRNEFNKVRDRVLLNSIDYQVLNFADRVGTRE